MKILGDDRFLSLKRNGSYTNIRNTITRRLENYLAWFKWTWCFKVRRSADELAELIVRQAARGTYEKTWRQYKVTPYPFYEYWIKQAKWDSRARRAIYGVA